MNEFAGILAAFFDPIKFLAFGGLGFFFAQAKRKISWAVPVGAFFLAMVSVTPELHRKIAFTPSSDTARPEPEFNPLSELPYEYQAYFLDYFIGVRSRAAMLSVMRQIDQYKRDCLVLTGSRDDYRWLQRCNEWTWTSTGFAGAIQFSLVLLIASYLQGWRFRPGEKVAKADAAVVSGAASLLRTFRRISSGTKNYRDRIKAAAEDPSRE